MTDELLDRVRATDPLPDGSTAPPFSEVLDHVRRSGSTSRLRGFGRWLAPALTIASVLVVVAVVSVAIFGTHHRRLIHPLRAPTEVTPTLAVPKGGMSGVVYLQGAGFASPSDGVISLQQCVGCRNGNPTAHSTSRYWLLTTANAGQTWKLSAERYGIQQLRFSGADGWAGGVQAGKGTGGIARYLVTRDHGRSWSVAATDAPNEGGGLVSLGGGEVWAVGLSNQVEILHTPVGGSRLAATATQPIHGDPTNVRVIAGGSRTAFVNNNNTAADWFVTHDDGNTWQHMTPTCSRRQYATLLAASGNTLWAACSPHLGQAVDLARSEDGGHSWRPLSRLSDGLFGLQPVSARVVWAQTNNGSVLHTTNGGQTWTTVWSPTNRRQAQIRPSIPPLRPSGMTPVLMAQGASSATVIVPITRGRIGEQARFTNLAVYATTDAGRTWRPEVVPLATR